jgi:hypothetical protein
LVIIETYSIDLISIRGTGSTGKIITKNQNAESRTIHSWSIPVTSAKKFYYVTAVSTS